jgi:uncharacterized protein
LVIKTKLIVNLTRGGAVCVGRLADRPLPRMRGLIGRPGLSSGEGLLISPAPAIHTAFMRFPIDAVFLDRDLTVLEVVEGLRPWKMASKRHARSVLELSAGESGRRGVHVGDRLELRDRRAAEDESTARRVDDGAPTSPVIAEPDLDWNAGRLGRLHPLRVLILSPDRRFRTVMSLLLARRNCSVTTTANVSRIDELVARERSDVLVVDVTGSAGDSSAPAADRFPHPVGVVIVADDASSSVSEGESVAKWGSFDELVTAINRANARRETQAAQP